MLCLCKVVTMSKKTNAIYISFEDAPGLHDALDKYRKSLGWTWKRILLTSIAETIYKRKDNAELVVEIVNYLEGRR